MGLFNNPPFEVIHEKEFERVLNVMRSRHRIPHELLKLWKSAAMAHINESGQFRGMDKKELSAYIGQVRMITKQAHPHHASYIDELEVELQKALKKSNYGGKPLGF